MDIPINGCSNHSEKSHFTVISKIASGHPSSSSQYSGSPKCGLPERAERIAMNTSCAVAINPFLSF